MKDIMYKCSLLMHHKCAEINGTTAQWCWQSVTAAYLHLRNITVYLCNYRHIVVVFSKRKPSWTSRPKFTILWGRVEEILLLNKFFPIVDTCLSCEDIARQSCTMVPRWWFLATFGSCICRAACSTLQTYILNSH